ncbi:MAG: GNAT family N-acetyltransferase [bacterium]|nr:GNAT family N-acetyltransferase [bacterium]
MYDSAPRTIPDTLVTYYLEMAQPPETSEPMHVDGLTVLEMTTPEVGYYRFLYDSVGEIFAWRDRRLMTDADLHAAITAPHIRIWVVYLHGVPCGYFELGFYESHTQIEYFGLRPAFHGRGLGKLLLQLTIAKAWERAIVPLRLHTCNLDSDSALPNYLRRGFTVIATETEPMPDRYRT